MPGHGLDGREVVRLVQRRQGDQLPQGRQDVRRRPGLGPEAIAGEALERPDGDRVVMYGTTAWRHTGTGKSFETRKVDLWRFRDGKAVEFCEFFDTATVQAAATP